MITQCPYCEINTAGQHAWNCPNNPRKIVIVGPDAQECINDPIPQKNIDDLCNWMARIYELLQKIEDRSKYW
jgi:hypothetical protein